MKRQHAAHSVLTSLVMALLLFLAVGTGAARAAVTCPDGMTSYWMLDETTGALFQDSVGGHTATCTQCPDFSSGRIGNALLFNGIDDALKVPAGSSFNWGVADSFSIEFWMRTDSSNPCIGNQVIIGRDDSATDLHWWVGCWDFTGVAVFRLNDRSGAGDLLFGSTPLNDGKWHHVVAMRNAVTGENSIFVDGKLEGSKVIAYTAGFDSASAPLTIGWLKLDPFYNYAGAIDEVALYSRALTEMEVRQHYLDGSAGLAWGYCTDCGVPARVMPLGDSITQGYNASTTDNDYMTGYRRPLYDELLAAGYNVDFVGGLQSGALALPAFDVDHEGHGGWEANGGAGGGIAPNVNGLLTANPADVVLLHIGTNDISNSNQNVQDITSILNNIDAYSQDISVVLARIINRNDDPARALATTQFNEQVAAMARTRIAAGDRIILVDQESALDYDTDMDDDLHPNAAGYGKMAGVWFSALDAFLPSCSPVSPLIVTSPVTSAYQGWPYVYNVDATGNPAPAYSFIGGTPAGMTMDPGTGIIRWTPSDLGSYPVTVSADNTVGTDSQPFTITVSAPPPCPSGIRHYWKLDEIRAGAYADFYGANSASCSDCPAAVSGRVDGAQMFDAISRVSVKDDNSFDWKAGDDFSLELWAMTDPASTCAGTQVLLGRDDSATSLHWWIGCSQSTGHARFFVQDKGGSNAGVTGSTDLTDGGWHHIAVTRNAASGMLRIYVDGALESSGSAAFPAGLDSRTAPLNIGWLNLKPYYHFVGAIDDVAMYDRELTAIEVRQHYAAGTGDRGYCDVLAPTIISSPVTTANENAPYAYDVDALGNPAPTYSLSVAPAGMTINPASGLISWTPAPGQAGNRNVTVAATNGSGTNTQSFVIAVTALPTYSLDISAVNGTVTRNPDQASYVVGTNVELTPMPDPGYTFTGWSGDATGSDNPLWITMNKNMAITATFTAIDYYSVLSPVTDERVASGTAYTIRWTAPPDAVRFKVKYSLDKGTTWKLVGKDILQRSHVWDVPPLVKDKQGCLLKVIGYSAAGVKLGSVTSTAFTIAGQVRIITPNGGGNPLTGGSYYPIEWQTGAAVDAAVRKVVLKYTKNGGRTWSKIAALTENNGSYDWTVPALGVQKDRCLVMVILKDGSGKTVAKDISDAFFSIQP